jgi:intein/homing endonuclease
MIDQPNRKFEEIYDVDDYEIWTDTGWRNVSKVCKTVPYEVWQLSLENDMQLKCADDHIVFSEGEEVFVKDLQIGQAIDTDDGEADVISLENTHSSENMYDVQVDDERYYSNGILSHNTTLVGVYILWYAMFNSDKTIGIVSNKEKSAKMILRRIKRMYESLPAWMKPGVKNYSETFIIFDNNTEITVSATSPDAFRGASLAILFCDEFAFVPRNQAEEFWAANYPTISASKEAKIIIASTPNGMYNLFHRIYTDGESGRNSFYTIRVSWEDDPTKDQEWADEQLKNLGKQKFLQEIDIQFLGSANTVIDSDVLKALMNKWEDPKFVDLDGHFLIYEKPQPGCKYTLGCLPENGKVLTDDGYKEVNKVLPSNLLLDESGNYTHIENIQIYKDYEGDIYDISLYGSFRKISFTEEHPILFSKKQNLKRDRNHPIYGNKRYRNFDFQYTEVKSITKDGWVRFPNIYRKEKNIDLDSIWEKYSSDTRVDFRIKNPLYDREFWWFIGIWLGDGWIQNNSDSYTVYTCYNPKTESHNADKVQQIMRKYNRKSLIYKKSKCLYNQFNCKQIHNFLLNEFGKYAEFKHIPEWVKYINVEYKKELIRGYLDSDGCMMYKNNRTMISFVSISLELLEGVQDILFSLGMLPSLSRLRKKCKRNICSRLCNIKETYNLRLDNYDAVTLKRMLGYENSLDIIHKNRNKRYSYFSRDYNNIYFRVKNVEKRKYRGNVYNFQTSSGSFLCRNITTHNCDVAKGTGEHYSVIQVLRMDSIKPIKMKQVAVYINNTVDVYKFSDIIDRVSYYYNNAHIMVENNSEGAAVVNRIWWDLENENLVNTGSKAVNLGIRASTKTKPRAVLLMKKLIEDGSLELVDRETIEELTSFVDEGGRYFGKEKEDDCVSGLYWATYVIEMNVLDESFEFKKSENEEDGWGVLADCTEGSEEDWSWLTADLRD